MANIPTTTSRGSEQKNKQCTGRYARLHTALQYDSIPAQPAGVHCCIAEQESLSASLVKTLEVCRARLSLQSQEISVRVGRPLLALFCRGSTKPGGNANAVLVVFSDMFETRSVAARGLTTAKTYTYMTGRKHTCTAVGNSHRGTLPRQQHRPF